MAKIRGKNEGSIHQRKNGTWRAQVSLDGQRLSFTGKTKRECQEWIKQTVQQIDHGLTYASTTITIEDHLESWLTIVKASKRHSTWLHYEHLFRNFVCPHIGKIKLKDLRPDQIQAFYNRLLACDVGVHTVIKIHIMLHSALGHALKTGLVNRNPADAAVPPKAPAKEMQFLDSSQVSLLLIAARGGRLEALLHIAVTTGMRQMEILGLKWTDLDWIEQTLKVERQLVRSGPGKVEFIAPKTKRGRRTVALGNRAIEVLRQQYEQQQTVRFAAGESWQEFGLIFTTKNGTPIHYRNLLRDYKILLRKVGLPEIRFHDLRHTAASLMLNHGIPVIVVSRRLGHAKPSITLDVYGHMIPTMQAEAAQKIDELITPVDVSQLHQLHPICTRNDPKSGPPPATPPYLGINRKIPPSLGVKRWAE